MLSFTELILGMPQSSSGTATSFGGDSGDFAQETTIALAPPAAPAWARLQEELLATTAALEMNLRAGVGGGSGGSAIIRQRSVESGGGGVGPCPATIPSAAKSLLAIAQSVLEGEGSTAAALLRTLDPSTGVLPVPTMAAARSAFSSWWQSFILRVESTASSTSAAQDPHASGGTSDAAPAAAATTQPDDKHRTPRGLTAAAGMPPSGNREALNAQLATEFKTIFSFYATLSAPYSHLPRGSSSGVFPSPDVEVHAQLKFCSWLMQQSLRDPEMMYFYLLALHSLPRRGRFHAGEASAGHRHVVLEVVASFAATLPPMATLVKANITQMQQQLQHSSVVPQRRQMSSLDGSSQPSATAYAEKEGEEEGTPQRQKSTTTGTANDDEDDGMVIDDDEKSNEDVFGYKDAEEERCLREAAASCGLPWLFTTDVRVPSTSGTTPTDRRDGLRVVLLRILQKALRQPSQQAASSSRTAQVAPPGGDHHSEPAAAAAAHGGSQHTCSGRRGASVSTNPAWQLMWARCGLLALGLLPQAAVDSILRSGNGASWYRAAASAMDRTAADAALAMAVTGAAPEPPASSVGRRPQGGDDEVAAALRPPTSTSARNLRARHPLLLFADVVHYAALTQDARQSSASSSRATQPGNSPLYLLAQTVNQQPKLFVKTSHRSPAAYFPFALAVQALTSLAVTEGRLKLSVISALLDIQRHATGFGCGAIMRAVYAGLLPSSGGRMGGAFTPMDERHRNGGSAAAVQQHIMEEGFVDVCALTLVVQLTTAAATLEGAKSDAIASNASENAPSSSLDLTRRTTTPASFWWWMGAAVPPPGPEHGYLKLPPQVADHLHPLEESIIYTADMLRSVITVSQHHSTNPVTFLLAPMGPKRTDLANALVDWLAHHAAASPATTSTLMLLVAACIHHNVRDVVPALMERNILQVVLRLLREEEHGNHSSGGDALTAGATTETPTPTVTVTANVLTPATADLRAAAQGGGGVQPPLVRLTTMPVLQAFCVHAQSRSAVYDAAPWLLRNVIAAVTESMTYPEHRAALSSRQLALREWPPKLPHDVLVTCGKEFFTILKELPPAIADPLYAQVVGELERMQCRLAFPSWKLRECLEQYVEFLSSIPSFGSGARGGGVGGDRDLSPFGLARGPLRGSRDDERGGGQLGTDMAGLTRAGMGTQLQRLVHGMLDLLPWSENPARQHPSGSVGDSGQSNSNRTLTPLDRPLVVERDDESPTDVDLAEIGRAAAEAVADLPSANHPVRTTAGGGGGVGSGTSTAVTTSAVIMSIDVLAPLLCRLEPRDFGSVIGPVVAAATRIAANCRAEKNVSEGDAETLSAILSLMNHLPESRRADHITMVKERLMAALNDAYCVAIQRHDRPMGSPRGVGTASGASSSAAVASSAAAASASQATHAGSTATTTTPAPRAVSTFMHGVQRMYSGANSAGHPSHASLMRGLRSSALGGASAMDVPTTTALERANEELANHVSELSFGAAVATKDSDGAKMLATLHEVNARLVAVTSMIAPSGRAASVTPSLPAVLNIRFGEVLRIAKTLVSLAAAYQPLMSPQPPPRRADGQAEGEDETTPRSASSTAPVPARHQRLRFAFGEAMDHVLDISKLAFCGNRLMSRDSDRRRSVCFLIYVFFDRWVPLGIVSKKTLAHALQLLATVCRDSIFNVPISSSSLRARQRRSGGAAESVLNADAFQSDDDQPTASAARLHAFSPPSPPSSSSVLPAAAAAADGPLGVFVPAPSFGGFGNSGLEDNIFFQPHRHRSFRDVARMPPPPPPPPPARRTSQLPGFPGFLGGVDRGEAQPSPLDHLDPVTGDEQVMNALRANVLDYLSDAVGPLAQHCDDNLQSGHTADGQQLLMPKNLHDVELRRCAAQVLHSAFHAPHYREVVAQTIATKLAQDFETYAPLLHIFGICVAQKGNLPLRRALAQNSGLPQLCTRWLETWLRRCSSSNSNSGRSDALQHSRDDSTHHVPGCRGPHGTLPLSLLESVFQFLCVLQFPVGASFPVNSNGRHHHHHHGGGGIVGSGSGPERLVCDHYQNGFCWNGQECSQAHYDNMVHVRIDLDSADRLVVDPFSRLFAARSTTESGNDRAATAVAESHTSVAAGEEQPTAAPAHPRAPLRTTPPSTLPRPNCLLPLRPQMLTGAAGNTLLDSASASSILQKVLAFLPLIATGTAAPGEGSARSFQPSTASELPWATGPNAAPVSTGATGSAGAASSTVPPRIVFYSAVRLAAQLLCSDLQASFSHVRAVPIATLLAYDADANQAHRENVAQLVRYGLEDAKTSEMLLYRSLIKVAQQLQLDDAQREVVVSPPLSADALAQLMSATGCEASEFCGVAEAAEAHAVDNDDDDHRSNNHHNRGAERTESTSPLPYPRLDEVHRCTFNLQELLRDFVHIAAKFSVVAPHVIAETCIPVEFHDKRVLRGPARHRSSVWLRPRPTASVSDATRAGAITTTTATNAAASTTIVGDFLTATATTSCDSAVVNTTTTTTAATRSFRTLAKEALRSLLDLAEAGAISADTLAVILCEISPLPHVQQAAFSKRFSSSTTTSASTSTSSSALLVSTLFGERHSLSIFLTLMFRNLKPRGTIFLASVASHYATQATAEILHAFSHVNKVESMTPAAAELFDQFLLGVDGLLHHGPAVSRERLLDELSKPRAIPILRAMFLNWRLVPKPAAAAALIYLAAHIRDTAKSKETDGVAPPPPSSSVAVATAAGDAHTGGVPLASAQPPQASSTTAAAFASADGGAHSMSNSTTAAGGVTLRSPMMMVTSAVNGTSAATALAPPPPPPHHHDILLGEVEDEVNEDEQASILVDGMHPRETTLDMMMDGDPHALILGVGSGGRAVPLDEEEAGGDDEEEDGDGEGDDDGNEEHEEEGDGDSEEGDDDDDDDDPDNDDGRGPADFVDATTHTSLPLVDDLDDEDDDGDADGFQLINSFGEEVEVRLLGGRRSLIVRGHTAGLDADPDFIRQLLYQAHMIDLRQHDEDGGGGRLGGAHRFWSRSARNGSSNRHYNHQLPVVAPEELSALMWQEAVGSGSMVVVVNRSPMATHLSPAAVAPPHASSGAVGVQTLGDVPSSNLMEEDEEELPFDALAALPPPPTSDDAAHALIMRLFEGSTRTPSTNRIVLDGISNERHDGGAIEREDSGGGGSRRVDDLRLDLPLNDDESRPPQPTGAERGAAAASSTASSSPSPLDDIRDNRPSPTFIPPPSQIRRDDDAVEGILPVPVGDEPLRGERRNVAPPAALSEGSETDTDMLRDRLDFARPIVFLDRETLADGEGEAVSSGSSNTTVPLESGITSEQQQNPPQPPHQDQQEQLQQQHSTEPLPWEGALEPQFLQELPPDVRADIVREHLPILVVDTPREVAEGRYTRIHPLFLAALSSELQEEILNMEAAFSPPEPQSAGTNAHDGGVAAPSTASLAPPAAGSSEALLLLALVTDEDLRRDILLSCDLTELASDPALHRQAVALRARQEEEREEQRRRREEARVRREEEARQRIEAERRREEAARLQSRQATHQLFHQRIFRNGDEDDALNLRRQRERLRRERAGRSMAPVRSFSELCTTPFPAEAILAVCRFVSNTYSASLAARALTGALEGKSVYAVALAINELLDWATKPLSREASHCFSCLVPSHGGSAVPAATSFTSGSAAGRGGTRSPVTGGGGGGAATIGGEIVLEGDTPPPFLVTRILTVLHHLVGRCRSAALAFVFLPSSEGSGSMTDATSATAESSPSSLPSRHEGRRTFEPLTEFDKEYLVRLPVLRILQLMRAHVALEVHVAAEKLLDALANVASDLECADASKKSSQGSSNSGGGSDPDVISPPPMVHDSTRMSIAHPRHQHVLYWTDTTSDSRYEARPYQCNVCRCTHHHWSYHCGSCQFDLCPACALDPVTHVQQRDRLARWGFWALGRTPLLEECASILADPKCRDDTARCIVRVLSRGIRASADDDAPFDDAVVLLERILSQHALVLLRSIREALRRVEVSLVESPLVSASSTGAGAASSSTSLLLQRSLSSTIAPSPDDGSGGEGEATEFDDLTRNQRLLEQRIASLFSLLELDDACMHHVHLLLLPYAETHRQLPVPLRNMWHASKVYLAEVCSLLAQHPHRLRAVLPAAAFPLFNAYVQFHLLYGSGGTESRSSAERTETEWLLSEKPVEVSRVSDAAVAAAALPVGRGGPASAAAVAQAQARESAAAAAASASTVEPLPSGVLRFCEANRSLVNTMIHWDPSLLDNQLRFMLRAPRLIDLDFKIKTFRRNIQRLRSRGAQVNLVVNRQNTFLDSFKALRDLEGPGPMHIRFQGEEGSDAGGLSREWFQLLGEEMINECYALFVHSSEGNTYQPNPCSGIQANHLEYFRFCGTVVGLAVYNDISLDIHFTRSVYRHLIGVTPCFRDVESVDPQLYANLEKLLTMDIEPEVFCHDFTVSYTKFGKTEEVELCPGGANMLVTNENKKDYIRLRSAFLMTTQIEDQLREFLTGFYRMVPRHEIVCFTEQELELVISGMPDIDVEDLRLNTEYNGFHPNSPVIRWFWEIVASMSRQDRANLLQFATGSSKVPHGGFAHLETSSGRHRFSITKVDMPIELLPQAHTCFNRIDLPDYPSAEILREKLMLAITYGNKGFAMV